MKKNVKTLFLLTLTALLLSGCSKTQNTSNYLMLVSKEYPLPENYTNTFKLVTADTVYEGEKTQVEKKAYDAFLELKASLKEIGIEIGIDSAYRSVDEQKRIMKDFTQKYGEDYAKKTVAQPGTSEHHTGLAIDIVPKVDGEWVTENADMMDLAELFFVIHRALAAHGFILRYPDGKEKTTGYAYEPWHIRYIGNKTIARRLMDEEITLEEYLLK